MVGGDRVTDLKVLRVVRLLRLMKLLRVLRAGRMFVRWVCAFVSLLWLPGRFRCSCCLLSNARSFGVIQRLFDVIRCSLGVIQRWESRMATDYAMLTLYLFVLSLLISRCHWLACAWSVMVSLDDLTAGNSLILPQIHVLCLELFVSDGISLCVPVIHCFWR
jgi:hypothetical protein